MFTFRPLPWEYGVRNLLRRPGRSALTVAGLTTVVVLVLVVVGFVRGLESSLSISGDPNVVLVHSRGTQENIEYSSLEGSIPGLLASSIQGIQTRYGKSYVSPELFLGTEVRHADADLPSFGLVRGVTPSVLLVRRAVQIVEGHWPEPGEILVGRLAATKLGWEPDILQVGRTIMLEGKPWRVSGSFAAGGAVFESEMWCPLTDLQNAMKRQDVTLVALTMGPEGNVGEVAAFCKKQQSLELEMTKERDYYAFLHQHYGPVRIAAWLVVGMVLGAGVFAGLNTMFGAVAGRVRELAMLQAVGFARRAIALSLVQEAALLAAFSSLVASALALFFLHNVAIRFTMGAFALQIDGVSILVGCVTGLLLGVIGAIPPAIRAMRMEVAVGLKAV